MKNMASIIRHHNHKILNASTPAPTYDCNCRKKDECPLDGACCEHNLVYQAIVTQTTNSVVKIYIGMTEGEFKTRFNNHVLSFNHKKYSTKTALSQYIWELKEKKLKYTINWRILKRATACNSGSKYCSLCTAEKLCILFADKRFLLNKRSELISKCRHDNKFYVNNLRF